MSEAHAQPLGVAEPGGRLRVDAIVVANAGGLPLPPGGSVRLYGCQGCAGVSAGAEVAVPAMAVGASALLEGGFEVRAKGEIRGGGAFAFQKYELRESLTLPFIRLSLRAFFLLRRQLLVDAMPLNAAGAAPFTAPFSFGVGGWMCGRPFGAGELAASGLSRWRAAVSEAQGRTPDAQKVRIPALPRI